MPILCKRRLHLIKEYSAEVRSAGGKSKAGRSFVPLRIAISGRDGLGVFETAEILGQNITVSRLETANNG